MKNNDRAAASPSNVYKDENYIHHLASAVNHLQEPVLSVNLEGIITSWNKAAEWLYGYKTEEAVGRPLAALSLPGEFKALMGNPDKIITAENAELYGTFSMPHGERRITIEVKLSPVINNNNTIIGILSIAKDVTEISSLTAAAELSEQRFRTITDVVPQIIWENDKNGKAIYFNQQFYDYSGCTNDQLYGFGWEVIAHSDDRSAVEKWRTALMDLAVFETEVRLRRFDGKYEWHLLRNVPLKKTPDGVTAWFGSATNIHALKEVQLQLMDTTERLQTTVETATDFAIVTMDRDGYIIDWNNGAEKMFGYNRTEAIGQHGELIFTPEDRYAGIPAVEFLTAIQTGRAIDERWHQRKDGSKFFMSGVMSVIRDSRLGGFVKVTRNITDRKLAEEALFLSEQRKSLAVQTAQMGEWEWDIPANRVEWSEKACRLLGVQSLSSPGPASFLNIVFAEDQEKVKEQFELAVKGLNVFQAEFRIARADNAGIKWMNAYGRVISHEENKPVRMIGVIYDITERKMIEKEKDDFINIASHELKTPVTSIKAYSDVLHEILTESSQPENAALIKKLTGQVDRLVQLIYNLLDSSSVAEGQMKIQPVTFDINELIAEQIQELELISTHHRLIWEPSPVPLIHADRNRIRQVITNFITNAFKYSPEHTQIIISARDAMDGVMVRVRDFGMGISAEDQAKIFNRYYRSGDEKKISYAGLGLGLFISAEIIRKHHGTIGVESTAGEGSIFYFKLPYA